MEYDLLVRGGRVVDGSGLPSYNADVAINRTNIGSGAFVAMTPPGAFPRRRLVC
jgi:N-acyl-D-aspartate/D-glutamate deacylase